MNNSNCENENCREFYPYYGLAPHTHDLSSGTFIGSTRIMDKSNWPEYFVEDKDEPGMGVWYCPFCFNGNKELTSTAEVMK